MFEWISNSVQWLENHPSVIAWLVGWLVGISAGEAAKRQLPLSMSEIAVIRWSQALAVAVGAGMAFAIWPKVAPNRFAYALCVGMSAPLAYEWVRAVVAKFAPEVANRIGVHGVIEKRRAKAEHQDKGEAT